MRVQISAKTDYAVRALLSLAAREPELVKIDTVVTEQGMPRKFVEAILGELRRAGLVRSQRGADGGYALARPAREVTLGSVLRAVDGPLAEVRGLRPHETAYPGVAEHLPEVWVAVRASLRRVLDETTLAQVLSGSLPPHVKRLIEAPTPGCRAEPVDLELVEGDITAQTVDAIVNAANRSLLGGGGVDGAIHRSGGPAILAACRELRATTYPDGLPTGEAVATTAGELSARWVIHTVGPIHGRGDSAQLAACYRNSLAVAASLGAESIAFPLISAGAYGWPLEDALRPAIDTIRGASGPIRARLVLLGERTYRQALRLAG